MIRVLVADDNVVMRDRIRGALQTYPGGAEVICVANGQEAVDLARREKFDVALLDIIMSPLTGQEAAKIITDEKLCAVVMVTSMGQKGAAFSTGWPVLIKPFPNSLAHSVIQEALSSCRA